LRQPIGPIPHLRFLTPEDGTSVRNYHYSLCNNPKQHVLTYFVAETWNLAQNLHLHNQTPQEELSLLLYLLELLNSEDGCQ